MVMATDIDVEIANLEESIKTLRFEVRDKEWSIKQFEMRIAQLHGDGPA